MLSTQQRASDVDVHRVHKIGQRKVQKWKDFRNPCGVHQNIAALVLGVNFCEGLGNGFGIANVQCDGLRLPTLLMKFIRQRLCMRQVQVGNPDLVASRSQSSADFRANAFGASGDHSDSLGCCWHGHT